jgi:hypothetical protein
MKKFIKHGYEGDVDYSTRERLGQAGSDLF